MLRSKTVMAIGQINVPVSFADLIALSVRILGAQTVGSFSIRTIIGNGQKQPIAAKDLDTVAAVEANLIEPSGLAIDAAGRLYFSDRDMVRRYDPAAGTVTRVAGQFSQPKTGESLGGDGGPAIRSRLFNAGGMVFDKENRRVVADAITIERRLSMLKLRRSSQRHDRKETFRGLCAQRIMCARL